MTLHCGLWVFSSWLCVSAASGLCVMRQARDEENVAAHLMMDSRE